MATMQHPTAHRNGGAYHPAADHPGPAAPAAAAALADPQAPTAKPDKPAESAYLAGRREWNERFGDYIKQRDAWRLHALIADGIAVLAVAGVVWIGAQNRLVPYVVKVSELGAQLPVGRADQAAPADVNVIRYQLAAWVSATRGVLLDAAAERKNLQTTYAMLSRNSPAYAVVNEHMRAHQPFERARTESVAIEVASVLPLAGDTWRVEWREVVRSRDGTVTSSQPWQAVITLTRTPPRDEATILVNPMGLYINAVNWSERL